MAEILGRLVSGPIAVRTSEGVAQIIRKGILAGFLAPGAELPERKLAEELSVSRTPVREALFTLQGEGLVELTSGRCGRVRHVSPEEIEQIFALRSVLETFAAGAAARQTNKTRLAAAAAALAVQERLGTSGSAQDQAQADLAFHEAIAMAAGSRLLETVMRQVLAVTVTYRSAYKYAGARSKQVRLEHEAILNAVESGGVAEAERLMRDHIATSVKVALEHFGTGRRDARPKMAKVVARSTLKANGRSPLVAKP